MVDSVGVKPFTVGDRSIGRIDRATAPRTIDTARNPAAQAPAPSRGIARELASAPPVDTDRVSRIRQAIANGTFPILPATIADRLLAFKLEWAPHDKA